MTTSQSNKQENAGAAACCAPAVDERAAATAEPCCGPAKAAAQSEASTASLREVVRAYYAERARTGNSCCGSDAGVAEEAAARVGAAVGYSEEDLGAAPEGANLGLGCGNPTAIDSIPAGATVLDLGSGAGLDCFLAAQKVGPDGYVIGVDMTPEMIERARQNASRAGINNVEFRLGIIEDLPVSSSSIDIVISNCVINLSVDKPRVFSEAFRVLRPGGTLMVSDLVLTRELPEFIRRSAEAYAGCIAGAQIREHYLAQIGAAGFVGIDVAGEDDYLFAVEAAGTADWLPESRREEALGFLDGAPAVISLKVIARKPAASE